MKYQPDAIEPKWQSKWSESDTFRTEDRSNKSKYYILDMFPYPSGHGLHVGHLKGYVASDIIARYKKMQGFNVLHPMGWDSFGLPTERQAEKDGITPEEVTSRNIKAFKRQMGLVGLGYDWSREFATSDESFYKWTQWIFLVLYEKGLAYEEDVPVNWCPALKTVVANEEVKDGFYIETGDPVERRTMRQWMLKITKYADRLLDDLNLLDWPEEVKSLQKNWIGRSNGSKIRFNIKDTNYNFEVFSTRPETLFGCSFCVLSPEHDLVDKIVTTKNEKNIDKYKNIVSSMSEREKIISKGSVSGVFTGAFAINPINGEEVPVFIADYVLAHHGTGAVFGCPAHDQRDYAFAKKFDLSIKPVIQGKDKKIPYEGQGEMINSEFLNGNNSSEAKNLLINKLESIGLGSKKTYYNLKDWLFSRQRYWGEPIPILKTPNGEYIPDNNLPLILPERTSRQDYSDLDAPSSPLEKYIDWINIKRENGEPARRESNVMPQWAGSSWYYLRFIDPSNDKSICDFGLQDYWLPVDLYVGGIEHANLHLLYARFWHKVLYDAGYVSSKEPFKRLFNQGKIQARSYKDKSGKYYYPREVFKEGEKWYLKSTKEELDTRIEKMSKSKYNVVTPDEVVDKFGADSVRLYEIFMGPLEDDIVWDTEGLTGTKRLLDRIWNIYRKSLEQKKLIDDEIVLKSLHITIKKVTEDIDRMKLNTAVSQIMVFVNDITKSAKGVLSFDALGSFVRLITPFAPHIAEEMWCGMGHTTFVSESEWPNYNHDFCIEKEVTIAVQVNGKVRSQISIKRDASEDEVKKEAFLEKNVDRWIDKSLPVRVIYVKNKIINIVNK